MGPGTVLKIWAEGDENRPCCEGYNCECNNLADVTIQGETDSFGFETINLCKSCREKMESEGKDAKAEFLKENSEMAPDGSVWLSVADLNDGSDWWMSYAKNKAEVLWDRQQADSRYGSHGGLFRPSLELVSEIHAKSVYERWCHRFEEDLYDVQSSDDDWDDDSEDGDDDDDKPEEEEDSNDM